MNAKIFFIAGVICLQFGMVSGNTLLGSSNDSFDQGIELYKKGQFAESYETLLKALEHSPGNLDLNFYLGRAAFEIGKFEMAVMAFERILIAAPDTPRIKLEMARSFHKLGANDIARQYCNEVLATTPPETVQLNIQNFLALIDKSEQKHFLHGRIISGVDFNNNIWASPSSNRIKTIIGEVDLTGDTSQKTADRVYNILAGVDHTYRFLNPNLSWETSTTLYQAVYDSTDALDLRFVGVSTGPAFNLGKNRFRFRLLANHIELDDTNYRKTAGVMTSINHAFNATTAINASLRYQIKDFPSSPGQDADNTSLSFDLNTKVYGNILTFGAGGRHEDASDDENSYYSYMSRLIVSRELPWGINGFLLYNYQYTKYDEPLSLFRERRNDHIHSASGDLKKKIWASSNRQQHIALNLSYQFTWADSNIELYEYDKELLQLSLIYSF